MKSLIYKRMRPCSQSQLVKASQLDLDGPAGLSNSSFGCEGCHLFRKIAGCWRLKIMGKVVLKAWQECHLSGVTLEGLQSPWQIGERGCGWWGEFILCILFWDKIKLEAWVEWGWSPAARACCWVFVVARATPAWLWEQLAEAAVRRLAWGSYISLGCKSCFAC